jgi:hypothetical protein
MVTLNIIIIIRDSPEVKKSVAGGSITFGGYGGLLRLFYALNPIDVLVTGIFSGNGSNLHDLCTRSFIGLVNRRETQSVGVKLSMFAD